MSSSSSTSEWVGNKLRRDLCHITYNNSFMYEELDNIFAIINNKSVGQSDHLMVAILAPYMVQIISNANCFQYEIEMDRKCQVLD